MSGWVVLALVAILTVTGRAADEVIPPAPKHYFNDYTGTVPGGTASELDRQLEDFERQTSSQIVVAIYPRMQSASSIEDYTVRVAESWHVGQKREDNGAVLFVFKEDRKLYLQVGYGLEGAIPDITAKRIIDNEITPRFRAGDFAGGLRAGIAAIMAAARGEYKGTGRTAADRNSNDGGSLSLFVLFGIFVLFLFLRRMARRGTVYNRRGRSTGWFMGPSSFGGGGGFRGGGGGGFSGGGGSFGGGGAGGSW